MHDYYDGLYKYLLNATFWFILLIIVLGIGMFGMLAYRGLKKEITYKSQAGFYTASFVFIDRCVEDEVPSIDSSLF